VVRDWTADPKAPGWSPAFSLYFFYFFRLKKCFQLCGFIHYFLPFLRKKNPKKKHGVWILDGAGSFFLSLTLIKWDPVVAPSWGKANKSASVAGSCNGAMPNWTLRTPIALCLVRRTEWTRVWGRQGFGTYPSVFQMEKACFGGRDWTEVDQSPPPLTTVVSKLNVEPPRGREKERSYRTLCSV